jgi:6-phosphofructokinase 1
MYGVKRILGIDGGYRGFYAKNTVSLDSKVVNDIHKRGGTILGTSRGGHDTTKIVDSIQDRGINQVYIIGGDGTQRGASVIFEEIRRRGLKVAVIGIPKTIDNDIPVIDKSFGFDTAVEEAQRAINAAHVEAESIENGIGVVKLMGRYSGENSLFYFFFALSSSLIRLFHKFVHCFNRVHSDVCHSSKQRCGLLFDSGVTILPGRRRRTV